MRVVALIVVLFGASCDREPTPAVETVAVADHELPGWEPLPPPNATVAQPRAWVPDGRPTVLLFSASWCPSCQASLLTDVALVRAYGDRFQIGIGLVEDSDAEFSRSPMARLLAEVPVWNTDSVRALAARCGAAAIPIACVVDRGRVVFRGSADSARHVLDAYGDARFDARLAGDAAAQAAVAARLGLGVGGDDIAEIVQATHGDHGWQNSIAWGLASRRDASATDVALAVALARDVNAASGGLDFSYLDTYQLALSKAGHADEAAAVGWRVLAVCKTVHADCMVERRRAYAFIYYARERSLQSRR